MVKAFKLIVGASSCSLLVCSDVGGSSVVGNKVMDLLREENYKREGKGSQYFEPLFIQYISMRKELLDIIELQVAVITGELVKSRPDMFKVPPTDLSMASRRLVKINPFNKGINPVTFQVYLQNILNLTEFLRSGVCGQERLPPLS